MKQIGSSNISEDWETFEKAFEYFGGRITKIQMGKAITTISESNQQLNFI